MIRLDGGRQNILDPNLDIADQNVEAQHVMLAGG